MRTGRAGALGAIGMLAPGHGVVVLALAICAEMIAVRAGRTGGPLRERAAPING